MFPLYVYEQYQQHTLHERYQNILGVICCYLYIIRINDYGIIFHLFGNWHSESNGIDMFLWHVLKLMLTVKVKNRYS